MSRYVFHWCDGHTEALFGTSPEDALNRAGYGSVAALDYWEQVSA